MFFFVFATQQERKIRRNLQEEEPKTLTNSFFSGKKEEREKDQ
jgi:hypothetical protein